MGSADAARGVFDVAVGGEGASQRELAIRKQLLQLVLDNPAFLLLVCLHVVLVLLELYVHLGLDALEDFLVGFAEGVVPWLLAFCFEVFAGGHH